MRRLSFVLLMLLSLDFGNPFVGGAFTFESSEDGVHRRRDATPAQGHLARVPEPAPADHLARFARTPQLEPRRQREPERWAAGLPRVHARSDSTPGASEDH